ncbi:MAG: hypothetical protein AAFZ15_07570 [Bacteroidota bacterium]
MKALLFLFIPFLFFTSSSVGQVQRSVDENSGKLEGKATFMTIFVDTSEDIWESEERDHFFREFEKSQEWIVDQAFGYGQEVEFDNNAFLFDNQEIIFVDAINMGENSPREIVRKIVHKRGYNSFKEFLKRNRYDGPISKLKIVLFVKSRGRSHAYKRRSIDNVDIAVVYCQSTFGMRTDQYVMSHEILHQFGAWDLYHGESQTKESAEKAKELYPNSIMINTYKNRSELEIDRLTAWRIGWYEYESEFDQFAWGNVWEAKQQENAANKKSKYSIKFDLDPEKRRKKKEAKKAKNR